MISTNRPFEFSADVWQTTAVMGGRAYPSWPAGARRGAVPERGRLLRGRPPDVRRAARFGDGYARRLLRSACSRGDKVGIFAGDRPEYLWALYGAALIGAVAVPVNGRFKVRELGHAITNAELKCAVLRRRLRRPRRARDRSARGPRDAGAAAVIAWDPARPTGSCDRRLRRRRAGAARARRTLTLARPRACCSTRRGTTAMPKGCVLSPRRDRAPSATRCATASRSPPTTACGRAAAVPPRRSLLALARLHASAARPTCAIAPLRARRGARADGARALHDRVPGVRDDLARRPQPPALRGRRLSALRLVLNVGVRERLRDDAGELRRAHAGLLHYGLHRARRLRVHSATSTTRSTRALTTYGRPLPGHGDPRHRPRDRRQPTPARIGEIICRGARRSAATTSDPEPTAPVDRRRGLLPHRRPRERSTPTAASRTVGPPEGHAQGRRRERRARPRSRAT